MSDAGELATIRKYLLGEITDGEQLRQIEERLFTDEQYYEELLRVEAELADQYASKELAAGEREKVEKIFRSTRARSRDLSFAVGVKEFLARRRGGTGATDPRGGAGSSGEPNVVGNNVKKIPVVKRIISSAPFKIAASVIIVFSLGAVVWRLFPHRSDVDRGLIALKEAYKVQRPTEARISVLDYAPPPNERGGSSQVDSEAKGRAGRFLEYAVADTPGAASYHALGNHLLAAGQPDDALAQLAKAASLDSNNAELQNDIGVALLEKAKAASADGEDGKALVEAGKSLTHFEKALELDASLLAALFNRALALEAINAPEQAREAWAKYLEQDSRSGWAEEARRHLDLLSERRQGRASQNKEQVLDEFLAAYRVGDDTRAWQVISRNREAITGKLVSAQLVDTYLDHALHSRVDSARELLQALRYAGELESTKTGDNYTADLARFYGRVPPGRLAVLSQAREHMRRGYEWCQKAKCDDATGAFEKAKAAFESAGDEPEVSFSEYWIGYSYHQTPPRSEDGLAVLRSLTRVCEERGYKWLLAQALNASANIQTVLKNYSDGIADTDRSLALSDQMGDSYTVQKNLAQQADKHRMLGNHTEMVKYIGRCLELSEALWPGARQMWRNYDSAARAFESLGNLPAALAYGREALRLSIAELDDPSTIYVSLTHLGSILGKSGNHEEGVALARQGLAIGQNLLGTPVGQKITAYCALQLGHLYRQAGDTAAAMKSYEQAIRIYDDLKFWIFSYDAHKGKLHCHIALGDDAASHRELRTALELVEANRKNIREEQNRHDYYNAEQGIYDLAADFAYTRLGDPRGAFEHSEASRARSLLGLMRRPRSPADWNPEPDEAPSISKPLTLAEIQGRIPGQAQILQYAVLEDKVLIWVVSRDAFEVRESKISSDELGESVRRYRQLVSSPPGDDDEEARGLAVRLYDILLKPVEHLLDGNKTLCLVPDKLLNQLPFGALVTPSGNYFVENHSLLFSPSSSVFTVSSEEARERSQSPGEKLLSVGNASFDRRAFPRLPGLPSAEIEAGKIMDFYRDKTCLVGRAATKERVTREMADADVAHLASHYVVDEDYPMNSRLLLANGGGTGPAAGGDLQTYDLYRMSLPRLRLAVLSACQTGVERFYKGEGMIGLSRSFIAAGVPTVVASLWPVDSDAAAELMISFHKYRKQQPPPEGSPTVGALRLAQRDMIAADWQRHRHPYYWAPFVVIGGYSPY